MNHKTKPALGAALLLSFSLGLTGCGAAAGMNASPVSAQAADETVAQNSSGTENGTSEETALSETGESVEIVDADELLTTEVVEPEDPGDKETEITDAFAVLSEDGTGFSVTGNVCTITAAGTYTLSGRLEEGQIRIEAPEDAKVTLILNGLFLSCSTDAPLLAVSADQLTIKAAEESWNKISDLRPEETSADTDASSGSEESTDAEDGSSNGGAICADCDLTVKGDGALVISSSNGSGIHCHKDLTVKNLTLKVDAKKNALKGNDSVRILSGEIQLISTDANGIRTENSDISDGGKQRGNVTVSGGTVSIFAAGDGIDAACSVTVSGEGNLKIVTGSRSAYTSEEALKEIKSSSSSSYNRNPNPWGSSSSSASTGISCKGIKAGSSIEIDGANIHIDADDDGIHAGSELLESGETGSGTVTAAGGFLDIASGDDGIHAENLLTLSGSRILVTESYEGLEGNQILLSGGEVTVTASDDGVNAGSGSATPQITVTGGTLDVTVPSGDTDGIDSNGSYTQSGGYVLVKGGNSSGSVAGSIDVDRQITVTGGTCIAIGGICETPASGSVNAYAARSASLSSGDYELTAEDGTVLASFSLASNYGGLWIASEDLAEGTAYSLTKDGTAAFSWTQESGTMGSSGSGFGFGGNGGGHGGGFGGGRGGF